jgi:hypothetical protein
LRKKRVTGEADGAWCDAVDRWSATELAEPSQYRVIGDVYRIEHPEKDLPDYREDGTGLIPSQWTPPRYKKKTARAATLAEKLKVLLKFRDKEPVKPLQTNFYAGDNDNYIYEEGDPKKVKLDTESEMPIRPSENEILARVESGVHFEKRLVAHRDFIGPDYKLVPKGGDVERDDSGVIKRMGGLRFNTVNKNLADRFSKHRGEMTQYLSGGKWRPIQDTPYQISGGPPSITVLNALFDKQLGAMPSNTNAKPNASIRNSLRQAALCRWNRLFEKLNDRKYGADKDGLRNWASKDYDLRRLQLDTMPQLPPLSMSETEARMFCGLPPKPANENRICFGLPYRTISGAQLSMAADRLVGNASTGQPAQHPAAAGLLSPLEAGCPAMRIFYAARQLQNL